MTLQLFLEERLAELDCVVLARLIESRFTPGGLCGLDDERRVPLFVLIGVHAPEAPPVLVAFEVEREGGEGTRRAEPHETVRPLVHHRLKMLGIAFPRSEEHTSELQSQSKLVCRLLLEKNNREKYHTMY